MDKLTRFLNETAPKLTRRYANDMGDALVQNSPASQVKVTACRTYEADESADELVITETIKFRLGHPPREQTSAVIYPLRAPK